MTDTYTHAQYLAEVKELNRHAHLYYVLDAPEISDYDYDVRFKKLQATEEANPAWVVQESPTARVGGAVLDSLPSVRHDGASLLSLGNGMTAAETYGKLMGMASDLGVSPDDLMFCAEPKYDGLANSLTYRFGVLVQAATRGDGEVGEDVTAQIRTVNTIPLRLPDAYCTMPRIEVRGEVLMTKERFNQLNAAQEAAGDKLFANPRNAAAGSVRQLNPALTAQRKLDFFAYSFGLCDGLDVPETQDAQIALMRDLGFQVSSEHTTLKGVSAVMTHFEEMQKKRESLPFEIDGVVYKVNSVEQQEELGWKSREPRWAIAYKFPPEEVASQLEAIDVQVSRTGKLTPVARIDPVKVGGVVVSNSTLHNVFDLRKRGVRVGDKVIVRRAGDVIPEIAGVVPGSRQAYLPNFKMPTTCPVCGSPVVRLKGDVAYSCTGGLTCEAQCAMAIAHFSSRKAMDIDGLAEGVIQKLIQAKLVQRPSDLYDLVMEDVAQLPGMGVPSATKLIAALKAATSPVLSKFLYALGIPGVGESTSKDLAKAFGSWEAVSQATEAQLQAVPDVGPVTASSIRAFFANSQNVSEVLTLSFAVSPQEMQVSAQAQSFQGLTFVITGTLSRERSEFAAMVEDRGGKVSGSVSKKTSYVLAGSAAGTKLTKAQELNIPVLDETAFMAMLSA